MVGEKAIRTAWGLGTAAIACVAAWCIPTAAQAQVAPTTGKPDAAQQCPTRTITEEPLRSREKPLELPSEWSSFADSAMDWVAIRTQLDAVHCVDTAWYDLADDFERIGDRFLGFSWVGYEAFGYVLIDTVGTGSSMDVGARPTFSPHRNRFAAVQVSDAGYGGFEGFAVWRTFEGGMTPEYVDTRLPYMADWRLDAWEGNDCIRLSAIPHDRIEDWEKLSEYTRESYVSGSANGWKLAPGSTCPTY